MKLGRISLLALLILVAGLLPAMSAAAGPPKEAFLARWTNPREGDVGTFDPECYRETGKAAHSRCGSWVFDLVECTNPKVCGTLEWWAHSWNMTPQFGGVQQTWRITVDENGYWEGTGTNIAHSSFGEMYVTIARFEGRGHGRFEGLLFKGDHWYEPGDPNNPDPTMDIRAFIGGEIIPTGQSK